MCNNKCYTIENITYDDLCSDCKNVIIHVLDNCNIIKDGHDIANIIISDILISIWLS